MSTREQLEPDRLLPPYNQMAGVDEALLRPLPAADFSFEEATRRLLAMLPMTHLPACRCDMPRWFLKAGRGSGQGRSLSSNHGLLARSLKANVRQQCSHRTSFDRAKPQPEPISNVI